MGQEAAKEPPEPAGLEALMRANLAGLDGLRKALKETIREQGVWTELLYGLEVLKENGNDIRDAAGIMAARKAETARLSLVPSRRVPSQGHGQRPLMALVPQSLS
jgi:hypothetical protein